MTIIIIQKGIEKSLTGSFVFKTQNSLIKEHETRHKIIEKIMNFFTRRVISFSIQNW